MFHLPLPRYWVIPILSLLGVLYFGFHAIHGNYGIRRMHQLRQEIAAAEKIMAETHHEKVLLQTKVKALSPSSLDMDQLEESAMRVLNMGAPENAVLFDETF